MSDDKRKSIVKFWAAVAVSAAFGLIVFPLGEKVFAYSIIFGFFYPLIHYGVAAFVYEMLSRRESVLRSFYAGLLSFNLTAILLSLFDWGYWLLIVLGLSFFAIFGIFGTSIGFVAAIALKGNRIRNLP